MARVVLTICRSCEPGKKQEYDRQQYSGESLYKAVKALRRERGLKEAFAVEESSCLGECKQPCVLELSGKKRPTYVRCEVHALADAAWVVESAVAYAALGPGEKIPDERLPGHAPD